MRIWRVKALSNIAHRSEWQNRCRAGTWRPRRGTFVCFCGLPRSTACQTNTCSNLRTSQSRLISTSEAFDLFCIYFHIFCIYFISIFSESKNSRNLFQWYDVEFNQNILQTNRQEVWGTLSHWWGRVEVVSKYDRLYLLHLCFMFDGCGGVSEPPHTYIIFMPGGQ